MNETGALPDFTFGWNTVTGFIKAWPTISVLICLFAGWLIHHRGIGANWLPGWAVKPKEGAPLPLTQQLAAAVATPIVNSEPIAVNASKDHDAVSLLRAGIAAGVGKQVLPAVEGLLTVQKPA